jgi:hypothetical protein
MRYIKTDRDVASRHNLSASTEIYHRGSHTLLECAAYAGWGHSAAQEGRANDAEEVDASKAKPASLLGTIRCLQRERNMGLRPITKSACRLARHFNLASNVRMRIDCKTCAASNVVIEPTLTHVIRRLLTGTGNATDLKAWRAN